MPVEVSRMSYEYGGMRNSRKLFGSFIKLNGASSMSRARALMSYLSSRAGKLNNSSQSMHA